MAPLDLTLSRRAVACPRWRWTEGMQAWEIRSGEEPFQVRVYAESQGGICVIHHGGNYWDTARFGALGIKAEHVPDLTDQPTLGGLTALVREAWADEDRPAAIFGIRYHCAADPGDGSGWCVEIGYRHWYGHLAEALVQALEAAP